MKALRLAIAATLLACGSGCTSTVTPIVTNVQYAQDGSLLVRSCDLTISPGAFHPDLTLEECHTDRHMPSPMPNPPSP